MTDRPTGPATARQTFLDALPLDEWHPINRHIVNEHLDAIEAETKARILAALPAALEADWFADYDRDAIRPDFARQAAALAAAIEKELESTPTEPVVTD